MLKHVSLALAFFFLERSSAESWTQWADPEATIVRTVTKVHYTCPCDNSLTETWLPWTSEGAGKGDSKETSVSTSSQHYTSVYSGFSTSDKSSSKEASTTRPAFTFTSTYSTSDHSGSTRPSSSDFTRSSYTGDSSSTGSLTSRRSSTSTTNSPYTTTGSAHSSSVHASDTTTTSHSTRTASPISSTTTSQTTTSTTTTTASTTTTPVTTTSTTTTTSSTTTTTTPTTTSTSTSTTTTTSATTTTPLTTATFSIVASGAPTTVPDGTSLQQIDANANGNLYESCYFGGGGDLYYIDPVTSYLYSVDSGYAAYSVNGADQGFFQFAPVAQTLLGGGVVCTCNIADVTVPEGLSIPNALNCACGTAPQRNLFFINPFQSQSYLALGNTRPPFVTSPAIYPRAIMV